MKSSLLKQKIILRRNVLNLMKRNEMRSSRICGLLVKVKLFRFITRNTYFWDLFKEKYWIEKNWHSSVGCIFFDCSIRTTTTWGMNETFLDKPYALIHELLQIFCQWNKWTQKKFFLFLAIINWDNKNGFITNKANWCLFTTNKTSLRHCDWLGSKIRVVVQFLNFQFPQLKR